MMNYEVLVVLRFDFRFRYFLSNASPAITISKAPAIQYQTGISSLKLIAVLSPVTTKLDQKNG